MTNEELCEVIGQLMADLAVPRSMGLLGKIPRAVDSWDKIHRELGFGWLSADDYADALRDRFVRD